MCIVEIHEMDFISINKAMTKESKQTKTKTFVFYGGFEKSRLEWGFKITTVEMIPIPGTLISRTRTKSRFPVLSRALQFYPRLLELSDISNQFSFPLKVRKIGILL